MIVADRSRIESIIAPLSDSICSISYSYKLSVEKSDCDRRSGKSDGLSAPNHYIFRLEAILFEKGES
jgi:hypothetical protein